MIELTHYSKDKFILDPERKYEQFNGEADSLINPLKPRGLWLSDDSDYGWAEWCQSEEFELNKLKMKTKFLVNPEKLIILRSHEDVKNFDLEYRFNPFCFRALYLINWNRVKDKYSGVLVTPYCYKARWDFTWYYGWDCASACVWDLSILTEK